MKWVELISLLPPRRRPSPLLLARLPHSEQRRVLLFHPDHFADGLRGERDQSRSGEPDNNEQITNCQSSSRSPSTAPRRCELLRASIASFPSLPSRSPVPGRSLTRPHAALLAPLHSYRTIVA